MATMKELQKKSDKDLKKMLDERREEIRSVRFSTAGSNLRDVSAARKNKKEIAQILTELNARNKQTA